MRKFVFLLLWSFPLAPMAADGTSGLIIINGELPVEYERAPSAAAAGTLLTIPAGEGAASLVVNAQVIPVTSGYTGPAIFEQAFQGAALDSSVGSRWVWSYGWRADTSELVFANQKMGGVVAGENLQATLRAQGINARYVPMTNQGTQRLMARMMAAGRPANPCGEWALVGGEGLKLEEITAISRKAPTAGSTTRSLPLEGVAGRRWLPCGTHCQPALASNWGTNQLRHLGLMEKYQVGEVVGWIVVVAVASDMAVQNVIEEHPEQVDPHAAAFWQTYVHDLVTLRPGYSPRKYSMDFARMVEEAPDETYSENRSRIFAYMDAARETTDPNIAWYYRRQADCFRDANRAYIANAMVKKPFRGLSPLERELYQSWAAHPYGRGEWPAVLENFRRKHGRNTR